MREYPILFNGAMVRAILAGQKTQTRRAVKNPPAGGFCGLKLTLGYPASKDSIWVGFGNPADPQYVRCPFGEPGDRLWVRETHAIFRTHGQHRADGERWGPWGGLPTTLSEGGKEIAYYREGFDRCDPGRWRPSIHMPRWACRLVLEITAVRVERLQTISARDCTAEGVTSRFTLHDGNDDLLDQFRELWTSTGGDWESNPWVWVIEFKRLEVAHG